MKHLGNITKIDGHDVPLVDIVTGGSPCQDLSVAGKRAGLNGERSGLFMEQIRIVKEMRNESFRQLSMRGATVDVRFIKPKYLVWENVPGAFSSNKGEDFRCVLEEVCRVADKTANVPKPEKEKWSTSGCIMGDGWSIAWRVHDAQFWGVPQRRKRISLVADFGGETAPEILFERKGLSGDIAESREKGEGVTTNIERSIDKAIAYNGSNITSPTNAANPKYGDACHTLTDDSRNYVVIKAETSIDKAISYGIDHVITTGGNCTAQGQCIYPEIEATLKAGGVHAVYSSKQETAHCNAISFQERAGKPGGGKGILLQNERTGALSTLNNQSVCYGFCSMNSNSMKSSNPHSGIYEADTSRTLDLNGGNPACNQGGMMVVQGADMYNQSLTGEKTMSITDATTDYKDPIKINDCRRTYQDITETLDCGITKGTGNQSVVRRLTPLECERLQGYPDHWTDIGEWVDTKGKKHKDADSPRYKALGNSIALPYWEWMAKRMVSHLDTEHPTMASLFDGIGGFPLVYSRCGCEPIWASEIEEFPIAVTKIRFPEREC